MARMRRARRSDEEEAGFTVLEAVIASTILLTVMSSLTMLTVGSFYLVGSARQQQAASFLANQIIEEVRALPYQTVANGLSDSDPTIAGDADIKVTGSAPNQTFTFVPTGEIIPHGNFNYTQAPLTPHQTTVTVNSTAYTVSVYPTMASGQTGVFRVTAIVDWKDSLHGGMARTSSAQTLIYSPGSNCLSADTHPFAAPCQSSFYATASSGAGAITVTPVAGSGIDAIAGIPLTQAQLVLTQVYSTAQIEQTSEVIGSAVTSGGLISVQGEPEETSGTVEASSDAVNDPAVTSPAPETSSAYQVAQPISYSDGSTLALAPATGDQASTTSVTNAGSGPACTDLTGVPQVNNLPCGFSSSEQSGGTATMQATVVAGSTSLGATTLASVGSPSSPTETFLTRSAGSPSSYCPGATGSGCIHAGAQRSVGDVAVAGLPPVLLASAPAGWGNASCNDTNALLQIDGFSDSVTAESGSGSGPPSASQNGGTIVYWNGDGCSSLAVDWEVDPGTISIPAMALSDPSVDDGVTVSIAATLSLGSTATASSTPSGCTTPCTASATSGSPVTATIQYTITDGASTLMDLSIVVGLGSLSASTSWQAAS